MITIKPSQTADTRTCDFANVSKATLLASSAQHIGDVGQALAFFGALVTAAAVRHDTDKLTDIDGFHADFVTGFVQTGWWGRHRALNRHHLQQTDGIPADVNLIDVLDFIADCVMAGMARSGSVYPISLPPELLERAFQNTVALLKANVVVAPVGETPARPDPTQDETDEAEWSKFLVEWVDYNLGKGHTDRAWNEFQEAKAAAEPPATEGQ